MTNMMYGVVLDPEQQADVQPKRNKHLGVTYVRSFACEDQIVLDVMERYAERSNEGMHRYGVPLAENHADFEEWATHLQEELMDATLYLERLKRSYKELMEQMNGSSTLQSD